MLEKFKNFDENENELETEIKSILQIIGNTTAKIEAGFIVQEINGKGKRKYPNIFHIFFKQFSANVECPTEHEIASANAHLKPLGYRIICFDCKKYELGFLLISDRFYAKMQKLDIKLVDDVQFKEWYLAKTFGEYNNNFNMDENPDLFRSLNSLFNERTLQGFIFRNDEQVVSIIKCGNEYETYYKDSDRFSGNCHVNMFLIYCQLDFIKNNENM